jgi:hypothetical protein
MSSLVKYLTMGIFTCGCVISALEHNKGENLLKNWSVYGEKDTVVIQDDGVIACECKSAKDIAGVVQDVKLNQTEAKPIKFSAESKSEMISGDLDSENYSIYLDIEHSDGTFTYGVSAPFKTGSHDWEKASLSYMPSKPVKSLSYYLVFRKKTGKAWFRNAVLIQK